MSVRIDRELCINCNTCVEHCTMDIYQEGDPTPSIVYPDECCACGACMMDCPTDAISFDLPRTLLPVGIKVKRGDAHATRDA